ncbi:hypothetical protein EDB80DRAFT_710886 [Ilyonectria destructans]|nr:hypothetical protein EDB80DRAFT_710886 [Ilyonectria destructans]
MDPRVRRAGEHSRQRDTPRTREHRHWHGWVRRRERNAASGQRRRAVQSKVMNRLAQIDVTITSDCAWGELMSRDRARLAAAGPPLWLAASLHRIGTFFPSSELATSRFFEIGHPRPDHHCVGGSKEPASTSNDHQSKPPPKAKASREEASLRSTGRLYWVHTPPAAMCQLSSSKPPSLARSQSHCKALRHCSFPDPKGGGPSQAREPRSWVILGFRSSPQVCQDQDLVPGPGAFPS